MKKVGFAIVLFCVVSFLSCKEETPYEEEKSGELSITSFVLSAANNSLSEDIKATITSDEIILESQQWIDNPKELIATFKTQGITVKIADVVQQSGVTTNNFLNNITYTVIAENGDKKEYALKFISPVNTGLPRINVTTEGAVEVVNKVDDIKAVIQVVDDNDIYSVTENGEIRGRGNSTLGYPKKPYRLKFDNKTSLFGLGAEKKWVLLANWQDPTLIMNSVAFELGRILGVPHANHVQHVEVFLNKTYKGSYLLTEQVEVTSNRVNVNEKTGFLVELDVYMDEDLQFYSNGFKLPVMVKSPEDPDIQFVKDAVHGLESALKSDVFPNTSYKDLIDIDLLVRFLIVNELCKNGELSWPKSTYMHKNSDGKILMGPLWDFDWGFGYAGSGHKYFENPQNLIFTKGLSNETYVGINFFSRFFDDPEFRSLYKRIWNEHKSSQFGNILNYIDDLANTLDLSQAENNKVWKNGCIYADEINKMKEWLTMRINSLDGQINNFE